MKLLSLFGFLIVLTSSHAANIFPMGAEHVRESKLRPDGKSDITCIDGVTEIRTPEEVRAGQVCTHIRQLNAEWRLAQLGVDDGVRFCDLSVKRLKAGERILKLQANFKAPCDVTESVTESCDGSVCSLRMGETFYSFEFTKSEWLVLTRLKDGFTGRFNYSGSKEDFEPGETTQTRLSTVGGKANILQVSQDGETWLPVCDDSFQDTRDSSARVNAEVACREMGFSAFSSATTNILISGSEIFGFGELGCKGSESSIHDCPGAKWKQENCSASEHVALTCVP